MTDEMADGILNMPELKQRYTALQAWLDESIEQATEELAECKEDDPNSFASGYETGTLGVLRAAKSQLDPNWKG